jgi:hypothetical protein
MIIAGEKVEQPVQSTPAPKVSTPPSKLAPIVPLEKVSMVAHTKYDKANEGILIVDGKEKKVSKQSQYILDMLSLDND